MPKDTAHLRSNQKIARYPTFTGRLYHLPSQPCKALHIIPASQYQKQVVLLGGKKRRQYKRRINNDISSDDLAIIGAGFTVLGDLFDLLSLLKLREETAENGKATSGEDTEELLVDEFLLLRNKK